MSEELDRVLAALKAIRQQFAIPVEEGPLLISAAQWEHVCRVAKPVETPFFLETPFFPGARIHLWRRP